jgi:hypothetical protein
MFKGDPTSMDNQMEPEFEKGWDKSVEAVAKVLGIDLEVNDLRTEDGRKNYKLWIKNKLVPKLPKSFFENSGNFTGTTDKAVVDGVEVRVHSGVFAFLNAPELQELLKDIPESNYAKPDKDIEAISRKTGSYSNLNSKLRDPEFIKQQEQRKKNGLFKLFKIFEDLIQEDINNLPFVVNYLQSTASTMQHSIRKGSSINFSTIFKNLKTFEEHQLPATALSKFLFYRAVEKFLTTKRYHQICIKFLLKVCQLG